MEKTVTVLSLLVQALLKKNYFPVKLKSLSLYVVISSMVTCLISALATCSTINCAMQLLVLTTKLKLLMFTGITHSEG